MSRFITFLREYGILPNASSQVACELDAWSLHVPDLRITMQQDPGRSSPSMAARGTVYGYFFSETTMYKDEIPVIN